MHEAHMGGRSFGSNEKPMLKQSVVQLKFLGANWVDEIEKSHETSSYYNYYLGSDQSKWASNVHGYGEAIMKELYKGIDLKIIEKEEQLKYEFHVGEFEDPSKIQMHYSGEVKVRVDEDGSLVVATPLGEIIEEKPYAYQIVNGNIREVECNFHLDARNVVTFDLGEYAEYAPLVIDPVLIFATYSGSPTDNFGMTATYGYDGTAYSGGIVFGNSYPTPAPAWDTTATLTTIAAQANQALVYGVTDVFISKYSPDGTSMLWTSFIGGGDDQQGTETVHSLICDQNNNVYFFGATSSLDFPIQGGYQTAHAGGTTGANFTQNGAHFLTNGTDLYVSKFSADGLSLMGSTYFGGSLNDGVNYTSPIAANDSLATNYGDQFRGEIMIDSAGNCMVASCSRSTDFPTMTPFQATNGGGQDGVIFKLSSDLSTLQWSSYYGGSQNDACYSVKIDSSYNIVFAGGTSSSDLPNTAGGWQSAYGGGKADGFVAKLNQTGTSVINASYLGMGLYDQAFFVEIDRNDHVFVVGQSEGGNFPVINSIYEDPGSSQFVIRFDETLLNVVSSTVWGSGNTAIDISPSAFLVDICGNIYISGWGKSLTGSVAPTGMTITNDAFQSNTTTPDFYLLVIERDFSGTLYGSYIGGNQAGEHVDGGTSRFDKNGIVYQSVCGGCGGNSDFPTSAGAWSSTNQSDNCNNLVFKFDFELIPDAEFTVDDNIGCAPFTVTFSNFSTESDSYLWDFGNGDTSTVIFEPTITYDSVGVYNVFLYVTDSICLLTDTAMITITVTDSLELTTSGDLELCVPTQVDLIAYTNGTAEYFIWSSNINFTDTLNPNTADSIFTTTPTGPAMYYVMVGNPGCSEIDSIYVDFIGSALVLSANDSICDGDQVPVTVTNTNPSITFTYVWSPDSIIVGGNTGDNIIVEPSVTQYVYVTASSNTGCVVDDSIQIFVGYIPQSSVSATSSEYVVPEGSTVVLTGQPSGMSYQWTPTEGVSSPNSQQTNAFVDQTTLYQFTVTDGICTRNDTVEVRVYAFVCDEPFLYIPNAFSPNGDGENDVLYVRGPAIKEMVFRIYDRWGEMVFESFDRSTGWDGTFRGKEMDPDVYDYYLKAICIDNVESIVKGNVTLLR